MNLLISGRLSHPPSSVHCFRDVTLYATIFADFDVLVACQRHNRDKHWKWLKSHGAFDFIEDIIDYNQEHGVSISPYSPCSIRLDSILETDLNRIIGHLSVYTAG
jgi:hypothetical protein